MVWKFYAASTSLCFLIRRLISRQTALSIARLPMGILCRVRIVRGKYFLRNTLSPENKPDALSTAHRFLRAACRRPTTAASRRQGHRKGLVDFPAFHSGPSPHLPTGLPQKHVNVDIFLVLPPHRLGINPPWFVFPHANVVVIPLPASVSSFKFPGYNPEFRFRFAPQLFGSNLFLTVHARTREQAVALVQSVDQTPKQATTPRRLSTNSYSAQQPPVCCQSIPKYAQRHSAKSRRASVAVVQFIFIQDLNAVVVQKSGSGSVASPSARITQCKLN